MNQPTLRVLMKPSGPNGAGITVLRMRDWLSGALEFQAICTKLGLLKMNNTGSDLGGRALALGDLIDAHIRLFLRNATIVFAVRCRFPDSPAVKLYKACCVL
ncbi:hypothetical protein LJR255_003164 [Pararhizobium sp. LjRoot255]|uniref:hypothetical protein n=1 Tax=Pararhizobium sp. LjRoot255 TaxID=3342298 RepID=UPI003ECFC902